MQSSVTRELRDKIPTEHGDLAVTVKVQCPYGIPVEDIVDRFASEIRRLHNPNQTTMFDGDDGDDE
jgi:hypothetical protein